MAEKSSSSHQSSEFLRYKLVEEGEPKFMWLGTVETLNVFFSCLGYCEVSWRQSKGNGKPHMFQSERKAGWTCTWYPSTKKLLVQGKEARTLLKKLEDVYKNPIELTATKYDEKPQTHGKRNINNTTGTAISEARPNCRNSIELPTTDFDEISIPNGMLSGKLVKDVIASKIGKWTREKAKIVVATPFLDPEGLTFITSCASEKADLNIYVRSVCYWKDPIDEVIKVAGMSDHWIIKHIHAINKKPNFHGKFLAGEYEERVDLVVTSCNMTKEHLNSEQLETLDRKTIDTEDFKTKWLQPLQAFADGRDLSSLMEKLYVSRSDSKGST